MRTWFPLSMVSLALAGPAAGPAVAQGVPTFDLRLFAERQAILDQTDQDLALQQDRLTREEELAEIERQQLASLEGLMDAMSLGSGDVAGTVAGLEAGQGTVGDIESAAASLYAPDDNNPATARMGMALPPTMILVALPLLVFGRRLEGTFGQRAGRGMRFFIGRPLRWLSGSRRRSWLRGRRRYRPYRAAPWRSG